MTKSNFSKLASQFALISLIAYIAPAAQAQSFDMSGMNLTNVNGGGNGMESMAASGNYGRRGFKTGQAPGESRLYGHETGFTKKGLGSMTTGLGHLCLPYAASAGLSPVFGYGRQVIMPPTFTTPLDDAITTIGSNGSFSVIPSTGQVYSRVGNVRTGIGFDGNGNASVRIDNGNGVGTTISNGQVNVNSGLLGGVAGGSGGSNSGF
ncbi:MAG: hypothetical protein Q8T09_21825 [Candidatus Melainabacteria bacterium]|nr:hypothetical protein [Candidatus Melainabacteria bacterium]